MTPDSQPNNVDIVIDPDVDRVHVIRHQVQRIENLETLREVGRLVLQRLEEIEGAQPVGQRRTRASLPERAILKLYLQLSPFVIVAIFVIPFCLLIYNMSLQIQQVMGLLQSEVLLASLVGAMAAFMIYFVGRGIRALLLRPTNFL